jgi:YggT family protein
MSLIAYIISLIINIYILIIILQVALSWLIAFNVVNEDNEKARDLMALLKRATDPVYEPIRKYVPPIGGIDLTPLIVIIALQLIEHFVVARLFYTLAY